MSNVAQIYIRDEKKPVFRCSLNEPNARLIVPIVNYFFEYRANQAAAPAQADPNTNPYMPPVIDANATGTPAAPEEE
jgi:hypothetical protein